MQKYFFYLNKCLDVYVVLLMFISVLLIKWLNISSNFNLMATYAIQVK